MYRSLAVLRSQDLIYRTYERIIFIFICWMQYAAKKKDPLPGIPEKMLREAQQRVSL